MTNTIQSIVEFAQEINRIKGVKSVEINRLKASPEKLLVKVRYNLWTYLWPGLNRKISLKVHEHIFNKKTLTFAVKLS